MTIDDRSINEHELIDNDMNEKTYHIEPTTTEKDSENVGFWLRLAAYIIDIIIISSINGILLGPLMFVNNGYPIEVSLWTVNGIIATVIYYVYFLVMTKQFQQTLGKMIVGIKVIQFDEKQLTWGDVFYREVIGRIIHNVFFFLKLMYLLVAFSKEKRGFHDMIGHTRVVFI